MSFCGKDGAWSIQKLTNHRFSILGGIIARRPLLFLIVPMIVTAILSTGVYWMETNRDLDLLYTDPNGKAARNKRMVERLFPHNTSIYNDLYRRTSFSQVTILILTAKDGGSILREEVIEEVVTIDNSLRNLKVEWKGRMANYSILCGKTFGKCTDTGLTEIVSNFQKLREGKYKIKYPLSVDNVTFYYKEYASLLGGVELDKEGYVVDTKALELAYWLDFSDPSKNEAIDKWEELVHNYFDSKCYKHIEFSLMNRPSSYGSARALTKKLLKVMPIVFGTIILFSTLTCMTDEWVTSKPFLGISTCLSAILAIGSGFGLAFFVGIQYQDSFLILAYVTLALEIDDGFMIIASWRNTNQEDSVPKRMEQTFYHTGTSITITSLTNILSCSIGMFTTSIPAFRMLCAMGVSCSFFAYLYLLTFFGACLALSGYSEERNTHSVSCLRSRKRRAKNSRSYSVKKGDIFMLFFRNNVANLLNYSTVKILVLIAFLGNLGVSLWGWRYLNYGLGITDIYPADTHASKYVNMFYKYYTKCTVPVHIIMKETLDYSDPKVQSSIEALLKQLESHPNIADSSLRISWLNYYKYSMQMTYGNMLYYGYNMTDKEDFLHGLRHVFLKNRNAIQFNFDIAFNAKYTEIVASRFILPMKDIKSYDSSIKASKELYEIIPKSDLPVEIHGFSFHLLEQSWIVKTMAIQIVTLSIGLSCLVFYIFSQNIRSSLCVALIVLCIVCEMVGYFSLWGVGIDLVSLTISTVSVGFSINYPAHMAFAFQTDPDLEPKERIRDAVYRLGFPMAQGTISTIFGLFVLFFQQLYVMKATFKVLSLIAFLSLFHSLLVIPIILDLFGLLGKTVIKEDVGRSFFPISRSIKEAGRNDTERTSL